MIRVTGYKELVSLRGETKRRKDNRETVTGETRQTNNQVMK